MTDRNVEPPRCDCGLPASIGDLCSECYICPPCDHGQGIGWVVVAKRPDRAGTAFEYGFASSLHTTLLGAETSQMISTEKAENGFDRFGHPVEYVLAEIREIPTPDSAVGVSGTRGEEEQP